MNGLRIRSVGTYSAHGSADEVTVLYKSAGFDVAGYVQARDGSWRNIIIGLSLEDFTVSLPRDRLQLSRALGIDTQQALTLAASPARPVLLSFTGEPAGNEAVPTSSPAATETLGGAICTYVPDEAPYDPEGSYTIGAAPNSVFALAGVIFVAENPDRRAHIWRNGMAPEAPISSFYDSFQFPLGPHYLNWLSPREYKHYYNRDWEPAPHEFGEIAALHLLCENLDRCAKMIANSGRPVRIIEHEHNGLRTLWVPPNPLDGLAFHITQHSAPEWLAARSEWPRRHLELLQPSSG